MLSMFRLTAKQFIRYFSIFCLVQIHYQEFTNKALSLRGRILIFIFLSNLLLLIVDNERTIDSAVLPSNRFCGFCYIAASYLCWSGDVNCLYLFQRSRQQEGNLKINSQGKQNCVHCLSVFYIRSYFFEGPADPLLIAEIISLTSRFVHFSKY